MIKKNGGITLIALVVTIIVLLILAGVTIAMLTGDNGIITRTNVSKMSQIEGQVQEEVKLAMQSAKIYAMQKAVETPGGGWFAEENFNESTTNAKDGIIDILKQDLKTEDGYTVSDVSPNGSAATVPGTIYVTYQTDDYKKATNYGDANIYAEIVVTGNKFDLYLMQRARNTDDIDYLIEPSDDPGSDSSGDSIIGG